VVTRKVRLSALHAEAVHAHPHLVGDLGRVRRARAQHDLRRAIHLQRRLDEVRHALLARDPPHEHHRRRTRVDAPALQHAGAGVRRVLLRVDAVVDHPHAPRIQRRVGLEHVAPHPLRDRDHRVGGLQRDLLAP